MKFKRNYLTVDDLSVIVANMIQREEAVNREILKVGITAQLLIEDLGEFKNCDDIYDLVMKENIDFNKEVINFNRIDYLVEQEIGMVKITKDFVNDMSKKITKSIENLDLNNVIKQLGEIANKDNITPVKSNLTKKKG